MLVEFGKTILERLGYGVTAMISSMEAPSIFKNHPDTFVAIIPDQAIPGMTGMDLAKQMLQIRSNISVILCTGPRTLVTEEQAQSEEGLRGL